MFSRDYPLVQAALCAVQAVVSVVCLLQALTWAGGTTEHRLAGISWVPVTPGHIATAWAVAGLLGAVGAFARHRTLQTLGVLALAVGPLLCAVPFMGAWIIGAAPNGWVTTVSYASWAAIVVAPYASVLWGLRHGAAAHPPTGPLPELPPREDEGGPAL